MTPCEVVLCTLAVLGIGLHSNLSRGPTVAAFNSIQLYGEECSLDKHCDEDSGMICHNEVCDCPTNTVVSNNNRRCLRVAALREACQEDDQCTKAAGPHARCHGNQCGCKVDATAVNNSCDKITPDGNFLCEDFQCSEKYGDNSICVNAACSCKPGYHMPFHHETSKECVRNIGLNEACISGDDCFLPMDDTGQHIECINNVCSCAQGYSPSDGSNTCSENGSSGSNRNTLSNFSCFVLYLTLILGPFFWH